MLDTHITPVPTARVAPAPTPAHQAARAVPLFTPVLTTRVVQVQITAHQVVAAPVQTTPVPTMHAAPAPTMPVPTTPVAQAPTPAHQALPAVHLTTALQVRAVRVQTIALQIPVVQLHQTTVLNGIGL